MIKKDETLKYIVIFVLLTIVVVSLFYVCDMNNVMFWHVTIGEKNLSFGTIKQNGEKALRWCSMVEDDRIEGGYYWGECKHLLTIKY